MAAGSDQSEVIANELLGETVVVWVGERAAHTTVGDVINVPFELILSADVPPSFGFGSYMDIAHMRYVVELIKVRPAPSAINTRDKFHICVVVSSNLVGNETRAQSHAWGRLKAEDKVPNYPWGEVCACQDGSMF